MPSPKQHETQLQFSYLPIAEIKANPRNTKRHPKKQLKVLADSIKQVGAITPAVINSDGVLLSGHGRIEAARIIGMESFPVVQADHMTEEQQRLYMLADNKIGQLGEWDDALLKIELEGLAILTPGIIEVSGFSTTEIDTRLEVLAAAPTEPEFDPEPLFPKIPVSRVGDVYVMGGHRLCCGDATYKDHYAAVMEGQLARMVFTDAPYNQPSREIGGKGKVKHGDFVMASGEMGKDQFIGFLGNYMRLAIAFSEVGSIHYHFMDWRHLHELLTAALPLYTEFKQLAVWNKVNAGMGTFYRSKHEMVCIFKNGSAPHVNNFGLGDTGRYRTNVWDYPGGTSFSKKRQDELAMHPTVKPVGLVADAIRDCSRRGDIILDPFGGSGTTIIAAERTGRRARCIELDPQYVDVIVQRWQQETGREAILESTGQTFAKVRAERLGEEG